MTARLGLSNVALKSGDIRKARTEANAFLESALQTADPHLQIQAWEVNARIALAENNQAAAQERVRHGLAILDQFDVPVVAWQIHALAHELFRHDRNDDIAQKHSACARTFISRIADSFPPDEPLREIFLRARPVSEILASTPQMARPSTQP